MMLDFSKLPNPVHQTGGQGGTRGTPSPTPAPASHRMGNAGGTVGDRLDAPAEK